MKAGAPLKIALAIGWVLAVPALSLLPPRFFHNLLAPSRPTLFGTDKVAHAAIYAIMTGLILWALAAPNRRLTVRMVWYVAVLSILYGALMEALQKLSRGILQRSGDLLDGLANAAGAVLVAVVWLLFRPRRQAARKP